MREDMTKVIVERPRYRGWGDREKGYRRGLGRIPLEEWERREGIKRRCRGGSKEFSDHLGPLRRFLRSNVGRPWDKVYSEICAQIRNRSPVQEHLRKHVFDFVEVHVVLIDGVPCRGDGWAHGTPLTHHFYVCPRSGLLKAIPTRRGKRRGDRS